jgi:putative lipoprotein (rSAM/lipoprotein system)
MLRLANKSISVFLGLILGVAACSDSATENGGPTATFKLSGKVVSKNDKLPIPEINIRFKESLGNIAASDSNGLWQNIYYRSDDCKSGCTLWAEDVDDEANLGRFISTPVDLKPKQTRQGSGSDLGDFEQKDILFEMELVPKDAGPLPAKEAGTTDGKTEARAIDGAQANDSQLKPDGTSTKDASAVH